MGLNEADTRSKLIDPALHSRGWTEDLIRREQTAGPVFALSAKPRVDYVLLLRLSSAREAVPVAILEAKPEDAPPTEGLEQAKQAAFSQELNVPFVFSTNGREFVEFDRTSGETGGPRSLSEFPTPQVLQAQCEHAFGIEVPSAHRSVVSLREVMESDAFKKHKGTLPIALGCDIAGQAVIADLVPMPHLLIAGATGSGKTVCLHSIVLSLVLNRSPEQVRMLLIDAKRVEFGIYRGISHLAAPVIADVRDAAYMLYTLIGRMEERYRRFEKQGYNDIAEYNASEPESLYRIVIVIDELAELMMQIKKAAEYSICRLAQLGRAAGIHLVVATQRPTAQIIPDSIKATMPSRIALAVASLADSRRIIGEAGAERLIDAGDMLYAASDSPQMVRIQGSFVRRPEIEAIVADIREEGTPDYLMQPPQFGEPAREFHEEWELDPAFRRELLHWLRTKREVSVRDLQRKFNIGYSDAGRIMDLLAAEGIIGPHRGAQPRQVLRGYDQ